MKRKFVPVLLLCLLLCGCAKTEELPTAAAETPAAVEEESVTSVSIAGREYEIETTTALSLDGQCTAQELTAALPQLTKAESVSISPCNLSIEEMLTLKESFPAVSFDFALPFGNSSFSSESESVDLSAEGKDIPSLLSLLPLSEAKSFDLSTWDISVADAEQLHAAAAEVEFVYPVEIYGMGFSSADSEIDFGELEIDDTAELESKLPLFNHLQKVIMLHTTLDNDSMEALNLRHEGTRFVWVVQVMTLGVRSDATYFTIYNAYELRYTREPVTNLRYCHDMIAIDLGHCGIGQEDLEFVRGCPKLQFLILAECYIHNLEPLRACPELRYLEAFKTYLDDISALLDCPRLTDLNICYIPSLGAEAADVLEQMTQLEHLWFCDANMPANRIIALRDALPNTEFIYWKGPESTGAGWREHDIYFEMRDVMERPYMD